ncbi:hypothetical protein CONPUDRAFT_88676 [Coniophora puteana RWD-64-598 SS2]|uniref:Uncharacterized protein n=1 Tax=Coniophora puteana (strain RWD-64-598) TaxID=741705 RepID=A0A5M3MZN7_CONPW|nr:uncharacterized protein CONPUDRAFT_88676 [Coniophora puteana RWD-64-598 SS2]EIW84457.1 hypothetical protein CONPUDRAFT_88676 [Coniophora puteana RWD-64-598 SS2]
MADLTPDELARKRKEERERAKAAEAVTEFTPERADELRQSLDEVRAHIVAASGAAQKHGSKPRLMAVSKTFTAGDVVACFEAGQRDFGENYLDMLQQKAALVGGELERKNLPKDIRWHYIGDIQHKGNKLVEIPTLYAVHTVYKLYHATDIDKALRKASSSPTSAPSPRTINIFLQIRTDEGKDVGLPPPPLTSTGTSNDSGTDDFAETEIAKLALHIVSSCPHLRLAGLMTIARETESARTDGGNADFETLVRTRDLLQAFLERVNAQRAEKGEGETLIRWGEEGDEGRLQLSMGMSGDYETALAMGADVIRLGRHVFGHRAYKPRKEKMA